MSSRGWTLRRRTALQFSFVATLFLVASGAGVSVLYRVVMAGELDEEVLEQVNELRASYLAGPGGSAEFERLVAPLSREEAETPIACIARTSASNDAWGPFGPDRLVALLPQTSNETDHEASSEVRRGADGLRFYAGALGEDLRLDIVLDGAEWQSRTRIFDLVILAIVVVGSVLSLLAGSVYGRRVGALLEQVARNVEQRSSGSEDDPTLHVPDAPVEIRSVVEAIEGKLRETRGEIERARLLAAGLAHDLRAPVQSLLTSTQVALLSEETEPRSQELLDEHLTQIRELARTVDNLVAWGSPRVDAAGTAVELDLAKELEARFKAEEEEAARRGVFLDFLYRGDVTLKGDPGTLVLAIRNLVGNAVTWSPPGGQVLLSVVGDAKGVEIAVEDEGPGVPEADRERIFEPFVRGPAAPGRRAGYGLGLALVAFAAERHGGSAHVETGSNGGARFVLRVRRARSGQGDQARA